MLEKWPTSEEDLASMVCEWLRDMHWEVYQEVKVGSGQVIDIVAIQNKVTWSIECKLSLSLAVMEQAYINYVFSNYSSVAVPYGCRRGRCHKNSFSGKILDVFGVGCLLVKNPSLCSTWSSLIEEPIKPKLFRRKSILFKYLREEQKTYAKAGNNKCDYWSPFKNTCKAVYDYVEKNPAVTLKHVVNTVSTHYASSATARASLANWIMQGKVKGVGYEMDGKHMLLYTFDPNISKG